MQKKARGGTALGIASSPCDATERGVISLKGVAFQISHANSETNLLPVLIAGVDFNLFVLFYHHRRSFDMAHPLGHPYPHPQPIRQDYDNDSETASPYASTTRLASNHNYYDHNPYNGSSLSLRSQLI